MNSVLFMKCPYLCRSGVVVAWRMNKKLPEIMNFDSLIQNDELEGNNFISILVSLTFTCMYTNEASTVHVKQCDTVH